jgi:hypothetical protein
LTLTFFGLTGFDVCWIQVAQPRFNWRTFLGTVVLADLLIATNLQVSSQDIFYVQIRHGYMPDTAELTYAVYFLILGVRKFVLSNGMFCLRFACVRELEM